MILRGRRLGFTLADIKDIIGLYDEAPGEIGQLQYFLTKIEERRADLEQKRRAMSNCACRIAKNWPNSTASSMAG